MVEEDHGDDGSAMYTSNATHDIHILQRIPVPKCNINFEARPEQKDNVLMKIEHIFRWTTSSKEEVRSAVHHRPIYQRKLRFLMALFMLRVFAFVIWLIQSPTTGSPSWYAFIKAPPDAGWTR